MSLNRHRISVNRLVLAERTQAQPASSDFFVGPRGDDIGPVTQNEMKVIGKDRLRKRG